MNSFELCVIPESIIQEEPSRSLVDAFEDMLKDIYYESYVSQLKKECQSEYDRQLFYFLQLYS